MRTVTIRSYQKDGRTLHGPIEIRFDETQFTVIDTLWLGKHPAYAIQRRDSGPVVAIIPTNDPDSIWEPGDEHFDLVNRTDSVLSSLRPESRWRRSPLQIKFCAPIPGF